MSDLLADDSILKSLHSGLQQGIALLAKHQSVQSIEELVLREDGQGMAVKVLVQLELPIQWMAAERSPNGVRSVEPVTLEFPLTYPTHAPMVRLRDDFDDSLAHVQPRFSTSAVYPCIYEGSLDELLHARGLWAILTQTVDWLQKAAMGALMNPDQGWEPIRRDEYRNIVIIEHDFIRAQVSLKRERHFFLPFTYNEIPSASTSDSSGLSFVYGQVESKAIQVHQHNVDNFFAQFPLSLLHSSLAIVVTPGMGSSKAPHVADHYHPEQVHDFGSLRQQAQEYGCLDSLETALQHLRKIMRGFSVVPGGSGQSTIAVILCARRPFNLIGEESEIEIVPYLLRVNIAASQQMLIQGDRTPVFPAAPHHAISPQLLRRFSGESAQVVQRDITLLGCGSLGSKVALHLARSGSAPTVVVDQKLMTAHNAARHGLIPPSSLFDRAWFFYKADALSLAIKALKQSTKAFIFDVTSLGNQPQHRSQVFPPETWAVVNATASLTVRETLSAITPEILPHRMIETSLFAESEVGIMTVEGAGRNPNSMDLIAQVYDRSRLDKRLQRLILTGEEVARSYSLGPGCSSITMAASDAKISLLASAMSLAIAKLRAEDFQSDGGQVTMWQISDDGIGLQATSFPVPPVQVIPINQNSGWTVRLSESAHQKILQDCARYSTVETGGVLVGRISHVQRAFLVTDAWTFPETYERFTTQFILKPGGMNTMLRQYQVSSGNSLYCLGTWHSHLTEVGASPQDHQTCEDLQQSRAEPFVLLIRTPGGYQAIAKEGESVLNGLDMRKSE